MAGSRKDGHGRRRRKRAAVDLQRSVGKERRDRVANVEEKAEKDQEENMNDNHMGSILTIALIMDDQRKMKKELCIKKYSIIINGEEESSQGEKKKGNKNRRREKERNG